MCRSNALATSILAIIIASCRSTPPELQKWIKEHCDLQMEDKDSAKYPVQLGSIWEKSYDFDVKVKVSCNEPMKIIRCTCYNLSGTLLATANAGTESTEFTPLHSYKEVATTNKKKALKDAIAAESKFTLSCLKPDVASVKSIQNGEVVTIGYF